MDNIKEFEREWYDSMFYVNVVSSSVCYDYKEDYKSQYQ